MRLIMLVARISLPAVLVVASLTLLPATAAAQDGAEPTTPPVEIDEVNDVDSPVGRIIPKPNSGSAPTEPGDRGGALQLTLLALIVVFFAVAVFSIRRQMRAAQREREAVASGSGSADEV